MGRTTRYVGIWQGVVIRRRPQWLGKGCLKKLTKGTWLAYLSTGWPRSSSQTSCEHQNKGCVLTNGPHSKPDLLFWCQREIWNKLLRHPVCDKETCGQNITKFCRRLSSMSPSSRMQKSARPCAAATFFGARCRAKSLVTRIFQFGISVKC